MALAFKNILSPDQRYNQIDQLNYVSQNFLGST